MYGVVRCPRCRRVQGVNLEAETATCVCGATLRVRQLRVIARVERLRDLATAVRRETIGTAKGRASLPREPARRNQRETLDLVVAAAAAVTERQGYFTVLDLDAELRPTGVRDVRPLFERLLRENAVYEVGPGRYRPV